MHHWLYSHSTQIVAKVGNRRLIGRRHEAIHGIVEQHWGISAPVVVVVVVGCVVVVVAAAIVQ